MGHRSVDINDPEIAVIFAELVTTKVKNPPRSYANDGPNWNYRPTEADKPWIADFERRRPRPEALL